jgi:hypothetical protein
MEKYRVIEEWTSYRIIEVDADSEDSAIDLVQAGEGVEVDGGCDNFCINATLAAEILNGGK